MRFGVQFIHGTNPELLHLKSYGSDATIIGDGGKASYQ